MKKTLLAATMVAAMFAVSCGNGGSKKAETTDTVAVEAVVDTACVAVDSTSVAAVDSVVVAQ